MEPGAVAAFFYARADCIKVFVEDLERSRVSGILANIVSHEPPWWQV